MKTKSETNYILKCIFIIVIHTFFVKQIHSLKLIIVIE